MATETGRCDSCGDEDVDVEVVQRLYVTPEDWDREERIQVVEELERWCWPCRTHYPHRAPTG